MTTKTGRASCILVFTNIRLLTGGTILLPLTLDTAIRMMFPGQEETW